MNQGYGSNNRSNDNVGGSHNSNNAPGGAEKGQFDLRRAIIEVMK
jgi:hypothetical protein